MQSLKTSGRIILDQLIPPTCLSCSDRIDSAAGLCGSCWQAVSFISTPFCYCCGSPFDLESDGVDVCGRCIQHPPIYSMQRSALIYDDHSRSMILGFKHGDRLDASPLFVKWLTGVGRDIFQQADIITAVPLHWRRLFKRKYNQSAILANAIGKAEDLTAIPDLLKRHRYTETQGHLSRAQRRSNVRGAFKITNRYRETVQGKVVILVDDVITSGATINACSRSLIQAGAREVRALTLARAINR
jgi:ComF family protein